MKDEKLTPLEKNVVLALLSRPQFRRWAGLPESGPLTLQQIADCLDVSPQTIQGIEARARLKLKEALCGCVKSRQRGNQKQNSIFG